MRITRLTVPTILLLIIAGIAAVDAAQTFLAPVILALVLGIVAAPLLVRITNLGVPRPLAAFVSLVIVGGVVVGLGVLLEPYIAMAIERAPILWSELQTNIQSFRHSFLGTNEVSTAFSDTPQEEVGDSALDDLPETVALFWAPSVASQIMIFAGTLFFFLLTREETYAQLGRLWPHLTQEMLENAELSVSRYFLTIAAINTALGMAVGTAMLALGMPSPGLWGGLAFLLNFVLYLGPIALAISLAITGFFVFDGLMSFLPALCYLALNMTEGQFVTPGLLGRSMRINPLLIFLTLVFWLWLWGPIGGIVAIPMLIWVDAVTGWWSADPEETPAKPAAPLAARN